MASRASLHATRALVEIEAHTHHHSIMLRIHRPAHKPLPELPWQLVQCTAHTDACCACVTIHATLEVQAPPSLGACPSSKHQPRPALTAGCTIPSRAPAIRAHPYSQVHPSYHLDLPVVSPRTHSQPRHRTRLRRSQLHPCSQLAPRQHHCRMASLRIEPQHICHLSHATHMNKHGHPRIT